MAGIFLLLSLCVVMALASFLAGALPLSMTLSHSQLRLISSIGVSGRYAGFVVPRPSRTESCAKGAVKLAIEERYEPTLAPAASIDLRRDMVGDELEHEHALSNIIISRAASESTELTQDTRDSDSSANAPGAPERDGDKHGEQGHAEIPAFEVGFSMVLGFVLMFLIDRLPRHATETFQSGPQTTHMSLDSLGVDGALADDEADGFLGS
ncbi:uncharacterized protein HRG_08763 [Hirsutella rhossiliensis]|uniref:Uncharacterized protein n=1 Tax=Hirsutella rhossiliensis TaxID=111463 RepID=A0A9P8MRL4_9HYPO|nr:uncharacterized protein HRG_08763 [Hirsutella rhossiliensis]KAH0960608.1 hypothetical protein HRG_08763 [Hirsutella rhossiliensis]